MAGHAATAVDRRIGERLKAERVAAGCTQRVVADAIGISPAQLQKYENGANRVSAATLQAIAGVLGRPIALFFDPEPAGQPPIREALEAEIERLTAVPAEAA